MPCTKCENGKYKWGKTGECKYDSKEECEKANPKKYSKMKPTPLGKKSYEEYEKELKEFNLSKVEKVELALIDDFEKKFDTTLDRDLKTSTSLTSIPSLTLLSNSFLKFLNSTNFFLGETSETEKCPFIDLFTLLDFKSSYES